MSADLDDLRQRLVDGMHESIPRVGLDRTYMEGVDATLAALEPVGWLCHWEHWPLLDRIHQHYNGSCPGTGYSHPCSPLYRITNERTQTGGS